MEAEIIAAMCIRDSEYAALLEKSEESFVVTLSGKLSGSYNAWLLYTSRCV